MQSIQARVATHDQILQMPLSPKAQRLTIALAGITYKLNIFWRRRRLLRILDISDRDGNGSKHPDP